MVRSPLTAASATFALKAGEWFRRGRLFMVSPVHGDYRRYQAEIPLIVLSRFPGPALGQGVSTRFAKTKLLRNDQTSGSPPPASGQTIADRKKTKTTQKQ